MDEVVGAAAVDPHPKVLVAFQQLDAGVAGGGWVGLGHLRNLFSGDDADDLAAPDVAALEDELLTKVNALGIGPQAVGGLNTALAVNILTFPTHIASLPVGVNIQCHSARHKEAVL